MKISDIGVRFIKNHEGLRLKAYKCAAGKDTIGYGHVVVSADNGKFPDWEITEKQADEILRKDLKRFEFVVNDAVKVTLKQNQYDALVSFAFNVGGDAFRKSTLLRKLNAGDLSGAYAEFPRWNRAGGKPCKGLDNRRKAEQTLWRGEYK